mmetsp:Transcript_82904/g.239568  ORF Transcript_82904/g.239568 Transcript_82904/m.239568 type:complete len:412 (-) Transcript_82904:293-1528(-)
MLPEAEQGECRLADFQGDNQQRRERQRRATRRRREGGAVNGRGPRHLLRRLRVLLFLLRRPFALRDAACGCPGALGLLVRGRRAPQAAEEALREGGHYAIDQRQAHRRRQRERLPDDGLGLPLGKNHAEQVQLAAYDGEPDGQSEVREECLDVPDRVPEAPPRVELSGVVPFGPLRAAVAEEEGEPTPQVLTEIPPGELVGVEDEGRVEPREDGDPNESPRKAACDAAEIHRDGSAEQQLHGVVVGQPGIVQVQAAHDFQAGAILAKPADKGAPMGGQAAARADVDGAAVADLVQHVEPDELGLENEEAPRASQPLLSQTADGGEEAHLHPDLREERQRLGGEEEDDDPRAPSRQGGRHRLAGGGLRTIHEGLERVLAIAGQNDQPGGEHDGHAQRHECLGEVVARMRIEE